MKLPMSFYRSLFPTLLSGTILLSSCDKGFKQLNVDPSNPTTNNPVYSLNNAELQSFGFYGLAVLAEQSTIVQQTGVVAINYLAGDLYKYNPGYETQIWDNIYPNAIKSLVDVINRTGGDPARTNVYNMARIHRVFSFQILTDTYGDVPYSQAGLGFLKTNLAPKYDAQKDIYFDMLNELDQATAALDASKPVETSELFFKGNITEWKRYGYSLMLRLAMRLVKVDPATAAKYAAKAVAGGVMQSNADDVILPHLDGVYNNLYGQTLNNTERARFYMADNLVSFFKSTADPRLPVIAVRYSDPGSATATANSSPAVQIGMPPGYDETTIANAPGFLPGPQYQYSQFNRATFATQGTPEFLVTYAQTLFLEAEAVKRGYITGDETALYNQGVTAAMQELPLHAAAGVSASALTVPESSITAYLKANPYSIANGFQQLGYQYWVNTIFNGVEAFANWRRTGYPVLQSLHGYPNTDTQGIPPRRLPYPAAESNVNTANYNAAIANMGGNLLTTRVWWDKP